MSIEDTRNRLVAFDDQMQTIHDLETLSLIYFFTLSVTMLGDDSWSKHAKPKCVHKKLEKIVLKCEVNTYYVLVFIDYWIFVTFHIMFRLFVLSNYNKMCGNIRRFKITLKISLELLLLDMLFTSSASWNVHENLFTVSRKNQDFDNSFNIIYLLKRYGSVKKSLRNLNENFI